MHKFLLKKCLVFFIGLTFLQNFAQELPPVEIYLPKQYGAENQNWSISQSKEKYIYIANNKGLLEFNGAKWQLYPSPNQTIMRSVNVVNNRIYTGCYMEFGYWQRNDFGILDYKSLSQSLNIPLIEDEQFWSIIDIDDWVLFHSLNRIYIYNTKTNDYKIIDSETTITKIYKVDESIYFQKINDGIYKIQNGKELLITDNVIVRNNEVVNIFNHNNKLLIETRQDGFYIFEKNNLIKWDIPANSLLSNISVYNSIKLKDNSFTLGTISNGIIHLTPEGEINYKINSTSGLNNNTVLSLFEDVDQNIWLGLDNGINCINITSPFSIYNDDKGEIGTVYASAVFNNNLYLGTNQGLFYKKINSDNSFKFIKGTNGQVWCLVSINNTLFCGHNNGTFIVNDDTVNKISNVQGTWNIKPIEENPNLLLQGNYNGLNILQKVGENWQFKNKIEGFDNSSKYFERFNNDEIFVSHEYKGVFKLKVNKEFTKVLTIVKESSAEKGLHSSLLKYNDDILYTYEDGIYKFNSKKNSFQKDSIYSKVFKDQGYTSGKLIIDNYTNTLWSFSDKGINYISQGKLSSTPKINRISLPSSLRKGMTGYESVSHIEAQKYLFGTSEGFIIIDLDKLNDKKYEIKINTIAKSTLNQSSILISESKLGDFKNNENNIEFTYSVAEFDKYLEVEYQYKLDGIYNNWSEWSTASSELFKNLPFGNYTFNVRARVGNTLTANTASYKFSIEKPWYLTSVMIVVYILSVLLFSLLMHNIYKRYYKKQREKLLEKTQKELELKKLENEQQLMSFKNEKLQQDIESKNRELAISTMSLIKKNEFLNNVKKELKGTDGSKNLKPVIKIIDKNLNNTDDWKFFQEAFNNADKDFLKKVKALHPTLTPNDLRLCAYLRLNLSSKEIAPLLNISTRSVEVKRYRLRKKMNLPHESSLTNYILEI